MNYKKEIKANRQMIFVIGLLTVFSFIILIGMWFGVTPRDVLPLKNTVDYINGTNVYIPQDISTIFNTRYQSDNTEFIYCLYGKTVSDGYSITEIKSTDVLSANGDSLEYKPCARSSSYLGTIHSHPQPENPRMYSTCKLSEQDVFTFGAENEPITAVICGIGKYAFYNKDDFSKSMSILVVAK